MYQWQTYNFYYLQQFFCNHEIMNMFSKGLGLIKMAVTYTAKQCSKMGSTYPWIMASINCLFTLSTATKIQARLLAILGYRRTKLTLK